MDVGKFTKDEKIVVAIIVVVMVLLSSLYFVGSIMEPRKISVGEVKNNVGNLVEVRGVVSHIKPTQRGESLKLYDEKFENFTWVYLLFQCKLNPGMLVSIRGEVRTSWQGVEVVVENMNDLRILKDYVSLPLWEIMKDPSFFENMSVRVSGNLSAMRMANYFEVTDGFNFTIVYVKNGYFGERNVFIHGKFENGIFVADNITMNYKGECASIGNLSSKKGSVWIHGNIVSYFYYGYLRSDGSSIKVVSDRKLPSGHVTLIGRIYYNSHTGTYELIVE